MLNNVFDFDKKHIYRLLPTFSIHNDHAHHTSKPHAHTNTYISTHFPQIWLIHTYMLLSVKKNLYTFNRE